MKKKKYLVLAAIMLVVGLVGTLTGCQNDADVASKNLSYAADNFQINRRIIFINTWSNTYLLEIDGACSVKSASDTTGTAGVAVTCKTGPNEFKKHYLGLSGNVTYFSEQLGPADVSTYRYKVTFKPTAIIPDVDLH